MEGLGRGVRGREVGGKCGWEGVGGEIHDR